ncbi:MAG TPA: hypothetical protein VGP88_06655 [Thermoplasmata archaeon]|nr:hypothetical protein [Thermoplasmata archaeon]
MLDDLAPATPDAAGPEPPRARPASFFRRLEEWAFPVERPIPPNHQGVPEPGKPEGMAYLIALAIGALSALLILREMATLPLPAGGDPAEWISTSYAYVGLPYPSWIVPGQYPPLLFPLLGTIVRAVGPIQAGRVFIGLVDVLITLSTYFLARTIVRSRAVALGAAGFVAMSPTLVQMYFFGGYPNLLGLVFLNLSVAFLLRFVRSGSGGHVFGFWVATAAAFLTHELVAVVLAGTLAVMFVFLLWQRRLPRTFYRDPLSYAGIAVLLVALGGFYGLTYLAGVPHPQYLQTSAFAYVKNGISQLYSVLYSPYLPSVHATVPVVQVLSLLIAAGIVLILCALRLLAPARLSLGVLAVLAMIATVIGGAIVGWELSVVTDYLRFGYFLVVPLGLGFALTVDFLIHLRFAPGRSAARARPSRPRSPGLRDAPTWTGVGAVIFAVAVAVLLLSTALVTYRDLPADESQNAQSFHDQTFLNAIHDIQNSGIAGNVFTEGGAAKWARALLVRNAYSPFIATRFTFDPSHLDEGEVTYFAMVARDSVTNNLVAATIAGTNATLDNQTPDYEASFFGVFTSIATLIAQNFTVTAENRNLGPITTPVLGGPTITEPTIGLPAMTLAYHERGYNFSIAIAIASTTPTARYAVSAEAWPGWKLLALHGNITAPAAKLEITNFKAGTVPGEVLLNPTGLPASLLTYANVTPAAALGKFQAFDHPNLLARAPLSLATPGGSVALNVTVVFTTPTARNLIDDLPTFINAPTVWQNWSIRFVLVTSGSTFITNHSSPIWWEVSYLQSEYGATVLATEGSWTVLLLPTNPD